jgi:hypothetical protein
MNALRLGFVVVVAFSFTFIPFARTSSHAQDAAAPESETAPAAAPATKPPEENPFPLIVRIDKSALSPYVDEDFDELRPVDEYVLGAHAVGQSRTRGFSRAELLPDANVAAFEVRFSGSTVSKTVSTQTPGKVYGRTFTRFVCKQRIEFDPRRGFVEAGEPTIEGDTELVYDGFGSTRRLGQRLIVRVVERRSYQLFEPARRIADRDNKRDTLQGFREEVAKLLDDANRGLDLVHYVDRFLGKEAKLQLFAKSATDCIQIGIGPEGERYAPMTALPPRQDRPAPIEVWAHYSLLGAPVMTLLDLAASQDQLPAPLQTKISQALSLSSVAGDSATTMDFRDGWLVLSLPEAAVAQPAASEDVARRDGTTEQK